MIKIDEENFIAEGLLQKCYRHPTDKKLSIKINKHNSIGENKLFKEIKYLKKLNRKNHDSFDYLFFSRLLGEVNTNLGKGYIYELITDEDTLEVSKTMEYYLLNSNHNITDQMIKNSFDQLINQMIKFKILAYDINANNICCKILKDGSVQMILIDGLGHNDFLPLVDWFSFFAKKKINRRIIKHRLHDLNAQRLHLNSGEKKENREKFEKAILLKKTKNN